jgi:methionyl-tRNA formyltransferase
MTKVLFLGTPKAAVPTLSGLVSAFEVGLVITQPDKPKGRSGKPTPSPVKIFAAEVGVTVAQPETSSELKAAIEDGGRFDVGVIVAYGRVLAGEVLALPTNGLLNLHFSLLPRWRGAAPVSRALIAGDTMSGVTIIRIDEGLDTGPVLTAQAVDVLPRENAGALTGRLAELGARLMVATIPEFLEGGIAPVDQTGDGATYAAKLTKEDRHLSIEGTPEEFVNRVRGLSPAPAATLEIDGEPHKVLEARIHHHHPDRGTWITADTVPVVAVGAAGVELVALQPSGKRIQSGADWVRGRQQGFGVVS